MENIRSIDKMLRIRKGNIVEIVEKYKIDAIVNAAHPTLRRGEGNCVDAAINQRLDELSGCENRLQELLKETWKESHNNENSVIKCKRGDILLTSGDKLCRYIIHTVGPQNDKNDKRPKVCSSSCIDTLRSCYRKIILEVLNNKSIETLAVPVLSSGNYGMDFELAFKVGISEVYNTLLEKKRQDTELFELSKLEKIYFVVKEDEDFEIARNIKADYQRVFKKENRISIFNTMESQSQYWKEVQLYDSKKGYFSIAKRFRECIIMIRFCSFYTYLKDWIGENDWEHRRKIVEFVTFAKMFLSVVALILLGLCMKPKWLCIVMTVIIGYGLVDTITYLVELIVLADIQSPSANIIRSIIMLFFNYFEAVFAIAVIGYAWIPSSVGVREILEFSMLGGEIENASDSWQYVCLSCLHSGIQFFFLSIAFAYFTNHLRQRKFRTK